MQSNTPVDEVILCNYSPCSCCWKTRCQNEVLLMWWSKLLMTAKQKYLLARPKNKTQASRLTSLEYVTKTETSSECSLGHVKHVGLIHFCLNAAKRRTITKRRLVMCSQPVLGDCKAPLVFWLFCCSVARKNLVHQFILTWCTCGPALHVTYCCSPVLSAHCPQEGKLSEHDVLFQPLPLFCFSL